MYAWSNIKGQGLNTTIIIYTLPCTNCNADSYSCFKVSGGKWRLWLLPIPRNLAVVIDYAKFEPLIEGFVGMVSSKCGLYFGLSLPFQVFWPLFCLHTWLFLPVCHKTRIFWVKPRQSNFPDYTPLLSAGHWIIIVRVAIGSYIQATSHKPSLAQYYHNTWWNIIFLT